MQHGPAGEKLLWMQADSLILVGGRTHGGKGLQREVFGDAIEGEAAG